MNGTVMITTGGTGGHVFPGLAVAARLLARGWRVFWLGTREGLEAKLVPEHGVEFEGIRFVGVRGKGLQRLLLGPFALGDVDYSTHEFDEITCRAENRMTNAVNVPNYATRMHNAIIHFFV